MKKICISIIFLLILFFSSIQINSQVFQDWVSRYNGTLNSIDAPTCMTVDIAGFIYVGGSSYRTGTSRDMFLVKLTSTGDTVWTRNYNGAGGGDYCFAIAADNAGNAYITGRADYGSTIMSDLVVVKFNSAGVQQWVYQYNGIASGIDQGDCIVVDNTGNVYVSGESRNIDNLDIVTIKLNPAGVPQWVNVYNGTGNGNDVPYSMVLAPSGDVVVGGKSIGSATGNDAVILDINPTTGVAQWVYRYNKSDETVKSVAVDASGNIYAAGYSDNGGTTHYDYLTFKLNSIGAVQWVSFYNGPGNSDDIGNALALHAAGFVYVTGKSMNSSANNDFATVKYDGATGASLWVSRYNGTGNGYDEATSLKVDAFGNAYIGGGSTTATNGQNFVTIKYNSDGAQQWLFSYNGPGNGNDFIRALALDNSNHVYVTGESIGNGTNQDFATIKYYQCNLNISAGNDTTITLGYGGQSVTLHGSAAGGIAPYHFVWSTGDTTQNITVSPNVTTSYYLSVTDTKNCTGYDTVTVFVTDVSCGEKKVYVCHKGHTICVDTNAVSAHLKHGDILGQCPSQNVSAKQDEVTLYDNYPNPFNPVTSISFNLPISSKAKLVIYDNIGREVATLVDGYLEAGKYKYEWNANNYASGIYFYKLVSNGFEQVRKMVLIK